MGMDETLLKMSEALESIENRLAANNDVPTTAQQGIGDTNTESRGLTKSDMFELRNELKHKDYNTLEFMFRQQAAKPGQGIPFQQWAAAGGAPVASALGGVDNQLVQKALDTGGATALIRQDLEPLLYALFVKVFPAWDRFPKEPANGLVHAWNQITSYGDAEFMTELGTVTDDVSVYERKTTPISVIGTRRGISLKSQFAVQAGGMAYNPEQIELQSGLRAVAHKMQKTIFQGNATATGGLSTNEYGLYDANAFDGLRSILASNTGNQNVNPFAGTPEVMRTAFDRAVTPVIDAGGMVSAIYIRATDKTTFDLQQDANVRYMDTQVQVVPGIMTNAVNTSAGALPLIVIPGDSIGTYTYSANSTADAYVIDESGITLPYLGSDSPTVLEIPTGISGQLTKLYIIFGMWGLATKVLPFHSKVRIRQA